jgi:hypothetical protein
MRELLEEMKVHNLESESGTAYHEARVDFLEPFLHERDTLFERHVGPPQPV